MYVFINGTDRTSNIIRDSISIYDELQERINSCIFRCSGFTPESYQEIIVYTGFPIVSSTANSVTLEKSYCDSLANNIFRVGSEVYVALNQSDEEKGDVLSISDDNGNIKLTFTENFTNTPAADELAGIRDICRKFLLELKDRNITTLNNLEYKYYCSRLSKSF